MKVHHQILPLFCSQLFWQSHRRYSDSQVFSNSRVHLHLQNFHDKINDVHKSFILSVRVVIIYQISLK